MYVRSMDTVDNFEIPIELLNPDRDPLQIRTAVLEGRWSS